MFKPLICCMANIKKALLNGNKGRERELHNLTVSTTDYYTFLNNTLLKFYCIYNSCT